MYVRVYTIHDTRYTISTSFVYTRSHLCATPLPTVRLYLLILYGVHLQWWYICSYCKLTVQSCSTATMPSMPNNFYKMYSSLLLFNSVVHVLMYSCVKSKCTQFRFRFELRGLIWKFCCNLKFSGGRGLEPPSSIVTSSMATTRTRTHINTHTQRWILRSINGTDTLKYNYNFELGNSILKISF